MKEVPLQDALKRALSELERRPEAFVDVAEIDWADPRVGRRFLRSCRRSEADTDREVEFISSLLRGAGAARVIDLMCGDGRVALPLSARGFSLCGVDVSAYAVHEARSLARQFESEARFFVGDARTWTHAESVDAVICIFGHFSGFPRVEAAQILARQAEHLRRGGLLLIDMHLSPSYLAELDGQRDWTFSPEGWLGTDNPALVLDDYCCDEFELTFTRRSLCVDLITGELSQFGQAGQFYSPRSLSSLLEASGFERFSFWGDFDGSGYDPLHSPNLIVLAQRR